MAKSDRSRDMQYAALPYRFAEKGTMEVMLITSRETGRWVVPKGWPTSGRKPHQDSFLCSAEATHAGFIEVALRLDPMVLR